MQWIGLVLKIWSWHLVGKQDRRAFVVGILSNVFLGIPAAMAGLWGVALACFLVTLIQLKSIKQHWN